MHWNKTWRPNSIACDQSFDANEVEVEDKEDEERKWAVQLTQRLQKEKEERHARN